MARGAVSPVLLLVLEHEGGSLLSLGVTAYTAPLIDVLCFPQMAIVTRKRVTIIVVLVASQAKPCLNSMLKRRSFPARWGPTLWAMAASTLVRGHACMRVIFSVAACTCLRGASEPARRRAARGRASPAAHAIGLLKGVAVNAAHLNVFSFKAEGDGLVVEVSQSVLSIVAIQAGCTEIPDVLDDKSRILFSMAHRTIGFRKREVGILLVASSAKHG